MSRDKIKINKSIKYSENATTDSGRRCRIHVRTYLVYGTLMTLICVQILSTEKKEKMLKIDK